MAALRGHKVALYERAQTLGGQVNLAARLPGREEIGEIAGWLIRQMPKCGVEVHLGCEVTPELIERAAPDALVIATGAEFNRTGFSGVIPDSIPGWDQPHVLTPEQVLSGEKQPGRRVVILDEDCREAAPGLAEMLARQGKKVTIVTSQPSVAKEMLYSLSLPHILARLAESGVEVIPTNYIKKINASSIELFNVCAPQVESSLSGIDTVILVTSKQTRNSLSAKMEGKVKELYAIGDCVAPREIGAAIYEGHRLARSL